MYAFNAKHERIFNTDTRVLWSWSSSFLFRTCLFFILSFVAHLFFVFTIFLFKSNNFANQRPCNNITFIPRNIPSRNILRFENFCLWPLHEQSIKVWFIKKSNDHCNKNFKLFGAEERKNREEKILNDFRIPKN